LIGGRCEEAWDKPEVVGAEKVSSEQQASNDLQAHMGANAALLQKWL